MANIRKTFNFRNGVQVDDDNFLVNQTGLVGIGTTVPTEALDVRGTVKVVGIVTATEGDYETLRVTNLIANGLNLTGGTVGSGVSIGAPGAAGIITAATNSGIVTYYGNGFYLQNLPTSQWTDIDVGLGFTSIYGQGWVGVSTNDPRYPLQIGGRLSSGAIVDGVGISSTGNIHASGIVTANNFVGDITGDITSGISTLGVANADTLVVAGVTTSAGFIGPITGAVTGDVTGNLTGNVTGSVYATGVSTFGDIKVTSGDITIAQGIVTATKFNGDFIGQLYNVAAGTASTITNLTSSQIDVTGGTVTTGTLNSSNSVLGVATVSTLKGTSIGLGVNPGTKPIDSSVTGISTVEFTGSDLSQIIIGTQASPLAGFGQSTAYIRFGSDPKSLDIINADSGNINQYLHASNVAAASTGTFSWLYGQGNSRLMTLTHEGWLGIGNTEPGAMLDVAGIGTFEQDLNVGGDLHVAGAVNGTVNITHLNNTPIYNPTGISTFYDINVTNNASVETISIGIATPISGVGLDGRTKTALFQSVGIGTTTTTSVLQVVGEGRFDSIGIGTYSGNDGLTVKGETVNFINSQVGLTTCGLNLDINSTIGIGTTSIRSVVDFGNAGGDSAQNIGKYLIPPRVTNAQRVGLNTVAGGLIYNTDTNAMEVWNGTTWEGQAAGGATSLNQLGDVTIGTPIEGDQLTHNGTAFVNDHTTTVTTTATSVTSLHSLPVATYRSAEYLIQGTRGTNYQTAKVLAVHNGTTASFTQYGTLETGVGIGTFLVDVSGGNMRLRVTPASTTSTEWKVKFTTIRV